MGQDLKADKLVNKPAGRQSNNNIYDSFSFVSASSSPSPPGEGARRR